MPKTTLQLISVGRHDSWFGIINFEKTIIMETVLIQINNSKAYRLLKDLEDLAIITVLQKDRKPDPEPTQKLSEKYAGKLPANVATELQEYVAKSREEWN